MATDYASAVRNGSMAAARLHEQLGTRKALEARGGSVDVFGTSLAINLPLLLRPLKTLLGAYLPDPIPGVLVTTERPLRIQRFTAAHELGHYRLEHLPSLDDESILRRMAMPDAGRDAGPGLQEIEADAFAVAFLMPRWLIEWHCRRQGWLARHLTTPFNVYQLSLRLGASYEALTWTLQRLKIVTASAGQGLRQTQRRELKLELLRDYKPINYRGDVWLLTERDGGTVIDGSRNDHFVLRLAEHAGSGYLWNIEQLKASGFAIVRDQTESMDDKGVGSPVIRRVTAAPEQPQRGEIKLSETRPWQTNAPMNELRLQYDLTGPEEEGLSRAERRQILKAA
jgi:Zn-dependent peptidase ImmA (M78 family)/predicted secreted protein